jgi:hypothetical protein
MSEFKMLRYFLNQGDRQENIALVEQELQAMGYKRCIDWVELKKEGSFFSYIITFIDGTYDFGDPWSGGFEAEDRPIPQQQQVTEEISKPSKEAREFWERAFIEFAQNVNCLNLADQAMAEWQKRFEA